MRQGGMDRIPLGPSRREIWSNERAFPGQAVNTIAFALTLPETTAAEADRALDRLLGWSDLLLGRETPHVVQWVHPETGALRTHRLTDRFSQYRCLEALLKDPLPPVGRTVRDIPLKDRWQGEAVYPVHIGWGEEGDHGTV